MKPILFNTNMVRAILDGRKTVTRRLLKPQPTASAQFIMGVCARGDYAFDDSIDSPGPDDRRVYMAPYSQDDILYVRETWSTKLSNECIAQPCHTGRCPYENCESADGPCFPEEYIYKATDSLPAYGGKWHPSIHMPKEAARIFLRVTNVRVEQLQKITDEGAKAEGANNGVGVDEKMRRSAIDRFADIWDSTIPRHPNKFKSYPYRWKDNPWVWVIEFERCEKPEE